MKNKILFSVSFFLFIFSTCVFSQMEKEYIYGTFRSRQLINTQTTEMLPVKSFDFTIRHRFGSMGLDSTAYQQFLGLDLPANIRFSFALPISKRLMIGAGRTKNGKTIDGEIKFLLFRQAEENNPPVNIALYFSPAITTGAFPLIPEYAYKPDSITPFRYRFSHRMAYNSQIIISRKFSEKFSAQIAGVLIYKNLVSPSEENQTLVVPVGLGYRTGINSSVLIEYAHRFNNRPRKNEYPIALAYEMGTVGHVFQIVFSSSQELIEQEIYTKNSFDYLKKKFCMGFNLRRTFWVKKKITHT